MSLRHESVFQSQPEEHAFRVTSVAGAIPTDLSGTVLRSGPGLMELGADCLNFFDGHALLAGVSFDGGRATFRSRYVRTPLYERETARKGVVQRRIFSNHPSRWSNLFALALGNSAMHDVYTWGDGDALRVIAGNDPGHFALDPRTLATRGPETWNGAVAPGEETSPMPYRDPRTGHLVGWIKSPGGVKPDRLRFVELDGGFRVVRSTPVHALAASPAIVHDQRATERWYVATEAAARLSAPKALWGARTVYEAFAAPPGATATLLLAPREGDGPMVRVPLPAPIEVAFHVINAWDDGDTVVVDLVTYGGRVRFEAAVPPAHRERLGVATAHGPLPTPMRFRVDPRAGRVVESRPLGTLPGEAPEVADGVMGSRHRYAYVPTLGASAPPDRGFYAWYDAVARIDVETGEARSWDAGALVSPVTFVARPGAAAEDDGWLLTWLIRDKGSALAILDARAVEAGPVATLELGVHLPGVSHTRWAPGVQLDA